MLLVEMPVGVQDTCMSHVVCILGAQYSRVELIYSTVIAEGIPPCLHANTTRGTTSHDGRDVPESHVGISWES